MTEKEKKAEYYRKNRERILAKSKEYAKENKEKITDYQKKYREENRGDLTRRANEYYHDNKSEILEKMRIYHSNPHVRDKKWEAMIFKKYKATPEWYYSKIEEQNFKCDICGTNETGTKHGKWSIDHCHKTGEKRSLLCPNCNTVLGKVKDDIEILQKCIDYIVKHKKDENETE